MFSFVELVFFRNMLYKKKKRDMLVWNSVKKIVTFSQCTKFTVRLKLSKLCLTKPRKHSLFWTRREIEGSFDS